MPDTSLLDIESVLPLGPTLFVAPSASANNAAPVPKSLIPVAIHASELAAATKDLVAILDDDLPTATRDVAGAVAAARAVSGLAQAVEDNLRFQQGIREEDKKGALLLRSKADDLAATAFNAVGPAMDPRKVMPGLANRVRDKVTAIMNLLYDGEFKKNVTAFARDTTVDLKVRTTNLFCLNAIEARALDAALRTERADEIRGLAIKILDSNDATTVPGMTIQEGKTLWDAFVAASLVGTSAVGNLPAPDSLSLALLKCYGAYRLPQAALTLSKATELEKALYQHIVGALKLQPAQEKALKALMGQIEDHQRDVIRAAEAGASAERLAAQNAVAESVAAAKDFLKTTYGPENEKFYQVFQRGPLVDSFVTVLCMLQLCAAFRELGDPNASKVQAVADLATSGLLGGCAVAVTVGKYGGELATLNLPIVRMNLASLGQAAVEHGSRIALYTGAIAIISGTIQTLCWFLGDRENTKDLILNVAGFSSGVCIVVGMASAGALASAVTGIGAAISVLIAAYSVYQFASEQFKSPTQVALERLLAGLKQKTTYSGRAAGLLGIVGAIEDVEKALRSWSPLMLIPDQNGAPTREDLLERLEEAGFPADVAETVVIDPVAVARAQDAASTQF